MWCVTVHKQNIHILWYVSVSAIYSILEHTNSAGSAVSTFENSKFNFILTLKKFSQTSVEIMNGGFSYEDHSKNNEQQFFYKLKFIVILKPSTSS